MKRGCRLIRLGAAFRRCAVAGLGLLAIAVIGPAGALAAPVKVFSAGITQGSQPDVITLGPDGNLWFTASDRVDRLNPSTGHVDQFTAGITPNSVGHGQAGGITAGPDGNVWFSEPTRPGIARITPSGVVTELPAFPTGSTPGAMTRGPDGNIWFVDDANLVGRINPTTLHVDAFPLSAGAGPESITTGPDGNLWVTESGDEANTRIARVTPSGKVKEFSNLGLSSLGLITSGADGNLWFSEPSHNAIGRSTTAGKITTFSAGLSPNFDPMEGSEGPEAITTGSDGNAWFTEGDHGLSVGRITSNGKITEFPHGLNLAKTVPTDGLTTGRDGNLWFPVTSTGTGGVDGIARFVTPLVLSKVSLAPTSFRAKKGTKLRLTLSKPATVKVVISQRVAGHLVKGQCKASAKTGKQCRLTRMRASLTFTGASGANRFKLLVKKLKPGRYKLVVTAVDPLGGASKPITIGFKVKKPGKKR